LRVAKDDNQARAIPSGGEFDAADLRRSDDVACDANDEEVPQTLIEHDLRRDARIRTSEDDRERLLPGGKLDAPGVTHESVGAAHVRREPQISLSQTLECLTCWNHGLFVALSSG